MGSKPVSYTHLDVYKRQTLIPAGISFSAGLLCLAMAQNLAMFCIAGILIGFGQNGISPVLMAISMRTVPEERKAAGNSTNYLGMDIGSAVAATAGGFMVSAFGYRLGFAAFILSLIHIFPLLQQSVYIHIFRHAVGDLSSIGVSQRIGGKISDRTLGPVDILQYTFGDICRAYTEILLVQIIPCLLYTSSVYKRQA